MASSTSHIDPLAMQTNLYRSPRIMPCLYILKTAWGCMGQLGWAGIQRNLEKSNMIMTGWKSDEQFPCEHARTTHRNMDGSFTRSNQVTKCQDVSGFHPKLGTFSRNRGDPGTILESELGPLCPGPLVLHTCKARKRLLQLDLGTSQAGGRSSRSCPRRPQSTESLAFTQQGSTNNDIFHIESYYQ